MAANDFDNLWQYKKAPRPDRFQRTILLGLVAAGVVAILNLADWWFREEHVANWVLFLLLTFMFWWGILRLMVVWKTWLRIRVPETPAAITGKTVAIFTTSSPGEPLSMFKKTLEACRNIRYPHTTYLLDDTGDPAFREVAEQYGAVWLELKGLPGAKAGKINAALQQTDEEFILVLDPDHIPFPNFLDEVLGFFEDASVGFVQVSQAYYNQYRSFTAKGAAEQTYSFYGPVQMGMHGHNCAVAIGANCTFRRKALESIGGHGIGLAEDLVTSIRIHSKGWKSVYQPVVVSRGLVPEELGSFCKQQLKWSRGVHEVLFAELPKCWKGLSGWQRLSYFSIGTYYFGGFIVFLFLLIPYLFLWFGWLPADMDFVSFLLKWTPVAVCGITIYLYVQQWMCDPLTERGLHWRGMVLKFACWPVFLLGFLLSLINKDIPYIPTAKKAVKGFTPFARPIIAHILIFIFSIVLVVLQRRYLTPEAKLALTSGEIWGMIAFASIAFIMACGALYAAIDSRNISAEEPWQQVAVNDIARDSAPHSFMPTTPPHE